MPPERQASPRLLTVRETAEWLGLSRRALWSLYIGGSLPHLRLGRAVRFDPRDVEAWIGRQKKGGHRDGH